MKQISTKMLAGAAVAALLLASGCATTPHNAATDQQQTVTGEYSEQEIVDASAGFLGTTAEAAGAAVEKVFKENGRPNAYIKGEEASGAIGVGVRYGKGTLYTKNGLTREVYWQGPSIGFDTGANASKVFTLVYDIQSPDQIYQRFPGVEGSAYFIGGIGVNYQRAEAITLAPMRVGLGFRAGVNVGYLAYTKERSVIPF